MKTKLLPAIGVGLIFNLIPALVLTAGAQVNIPGVFNTGVDDSGNLLAGGATDPHWTITSSPIASGAISALVVSNINDAWISDSAISQWINATGDGKDIETAGLYVYTLTFSLTGFIPSTASILGEWASDNESEIYLNGVNTGFANDTNGFSLYKPFSITSGFVDGENELQFYVNQDQSGSKDKDNPEGLQVRFVDATAEAVPEPATTTLLLMALSVFVINRAATVRERAASPKMEDGRL